MTGTGTAGSSGPSSLGRYAPDPTGARLVEVQLLRLPVAVMAAAREHHDGLMREYKLLALSGRAAEQDAPRRLLELVEILGRQYASSRSRRDEELETALREGRGTVDLVDRVPVTAKVAVEGLRTLMAESDEFCERALLMTLPRPELLRRFGDWYTGQYAAQIDGEPPTPWDGPLRAEGYVSG